MEQPEAIDTSRATRSAWPLALGLLAIAASTRVWYALTKSLVLDEFHSTYHAFAASGADFLSRLALDNHPPLSFLLIGTASEALGRSELALRSPAIVLGLVEIALVARLAAQLGASRGRALLAAALLATSAMHFDYGTQARMYVPHALMITACLSAFVTLVREDGEGRGAPRSVSRSEPRPRSTPTTTPSSTSPFSQRPAPWQSDSLPAASRASPCR